MSLSFCRLCLNSNFLLNIFKLDDDIPFKTMLCTGIVIENKDDFPSVICKPCVRKVRKFYEFKQKCLDVDSCVKKILTNMKYSDIYVSSSSIVHSDDFNNYTCDDIKIEPKSNLRKERVAIMKTSQSLDTFLCEFCGQIIKKRKAFVRHSRSHLGIKLFSCKICFKKFSRASHKVVHLRSHFGIKPFICDICGRSSTKKQDLIRHMKIHTDERNFACPKCDHKFKRSSDVHSHLRTHTSLRPFKCEVCGKDYRSHSGLRKHYNTYCKKKTL